MMGRILTTCALASLFSLNIALADWTPAYLDGSAELMWSDDVQIASAWVSGNWEAESHELHVRMDALRHEVDYQPNEAIDPFGEAEGISDTLISGELGYTWLGEDESAPETAVTGSIYEGFRNFSSMWLDTYYRQQYGSGGLPGVAYEDPEPWGYGVTVSHRREVIPASTYVTVSGAYLRDQVAPGYEIEDLGTSFELIRGERILHTWTGAVELETLLNRRARINSSFRLTDTTSRELRWSWNGNLHIALPASWISRTSVSFASEEPNFEAWSLAQTFEKSLSPDWSVAIQGRVYEDTGQIETANLISSAAPALQTWQAFLSIRRALGGSDSAITLRTGPYFTRYGETGIGTERFEHLYADRDWWWTQVAWRVRF